MTNNSFDFNNTTHWELVESWPDVLDKKFSTHRAWTRLFDGDLIFTIIPVGQTPSDGAGGYRSVAAALKAKGMV